jgi:hypothetical protein
MTTANIVGVHGISQQQSGRHQLLPLWERAVRDGVERTVGRHAPAIDLDLGYYGHLYVDATGTKGGDVTPDELDADEVAFFDDIESQVVDDDPPEEAVKGFPGVPRPVGRLTAWLDRRFGVAGRLLFFGDLVQVRRYQRDDDLAVAVRDRVREAIGPMTQVLIGHSLGSVVAYEYLCLEPDQGVETLITLGSPLALRSVQDALRTAGPDGRPAAPPGVTRWVNVLDPRDPVACGGTLAPTWHAVLDEVVDNESDPHAAVRYLGKRQTGQAVVASLQS